MAVLVIFRRKIAGPLTLVIWNFRRYSILDLQARTRQTDKRKKNDRRFDLMLAPSVRQRGIIMRRCYQVCTASYGGDGMVLVTGRDGRRKGSSLVQCYAEVTDVGQLTAIKLTHTGHTVIKRTTVLHYDIGLCLLLCQLRQKQLSNTARNQAVRIQTAAAANSIRRTAHLTDCERRQRRMLISNSN